MSPSKGSRYEIRDGKRIKLTDQEQRERNRAKVKLWRTKNAQHYRDYMRELMGQKKAKANDGTIIEG